MCTHTRKKNGQLLNQLSSIRKKNFTSYCENNQERKRTGKNEGFHLGAVWEQLDCLFYSRLLLFVAKVTLGKD